MPSASVCEAFGGGRAAQQLGDQLGELAPDRGALVGERAGALGDLAEQDRPRVALALDEVEDREQAVPELLVGWRAGVDAVAQRRQQPQPRPPHARLVEALLGAEVRVDHRLGDAGGLRDRVDGGRVEAALGERALGRLEHLLLAHLARHAARSAGCARSHGSCWGHPGYITPRNLLAVTSGRDPDVPKLLTTLCAAIATGLLLPAGALAQAGEKSDPAGGAAIGEVVLATAMAGVVTAIALVVVIGHRSGRVRVRRPRRGLLREAHRRARLGVAAERVRRRRAADRRDRHVLGHLPAHRQRPRSRAARQPRALPDPVRPVRDLRRGPALDGAARAGRQAQRDGRAPAEGLVRAARRRADDGVRRLRARGLPARRRLAPAVRPGRDAVGPDAPDADRRRLAGHAGRRDADRRGRARRDQERPRAEQELPGPAPGAARRRLPRRPLDRAGRVRLLGAAVPAAVPPRAADARRLDRARDRAHLDRPRRRADGRLRLPADPRPADRPGRRRVGPDDAALPALHRRGGRRRGRGAAADGAQAGAVRRRLGRRDRHGRPRGRVGLVARVDDDVVADLAAARGRDLRAAGRRLRRRARRRDRPRARPARGGPRTVTALGRDPGRRRARRWRSRTRCRSPTATRSPRS